MNNREINELMKKHVRNERISTTKILKLIALASDQKLDLELGYPDILHWLMEEHKYSERAARRRITAARVYRAVSEIIEKIETGDLDLSSLNRAQSAIWFEEKRTGKKMDVEKKREVLSKIENKSGDDIKRALISIFPEMSSEVKRDHVSVIDENTSRLSVNLSNEAMADLEWAMNFKSHAMPNASRSDIIAFVLHDFRKRNDVMMNPPNEKKTKARDREAVESFKKGGGNLAGEGIAVGTAENAKNEASGAALAPCDKSSYPKQKRPSSRVRKFVLHRAGCLCEFVDPVSGRRCNSPIRPENDHVEL